MVYLFIVGLLAVCVIQEAGWEASIPNQKCRIYRQETQACAILCTLHQLQVRIRIFVSPHFSAI